MIAISDLVELYGYPADRLICTAESVHLPKADSRESQHWMETHPHMCRETNGASCVAIHYPGSWPAFIAQQVEKRVAA